MKTIFDMNEELINRGLLLIFDKWDRTIYIPNKENPKIIISESPVANTFQYQYKNEKGVKAVEENYKSIMYRIEDYIRANTPKEKKVAGEAPTDTQEKIVSITWIRKLIKNVDFVISIDDDGLPYCVCKDLYTTVEPNQECDETDSCGNLMFAARKKKNNKLLEGLKNEKKQKLR